MGILDFFKPKKEAKPYNPFDVAQAKRGEINGFLRRIVNHSLILLIVGRRGSGKTALAFKILEVFKKKSKRKIYILGYEKTSLPFWIRKIKDINLIPNNSVVLVDEGAIAFFSRDSMKKPNKEISKLMTIARHKNLSLILITQSSSMIDVNILRLADTLLLKEPSLLQSKFERKALREFYHEIDPLFKDIQQKQKHVYIYDDEFEGLLKYNLPEFWNEKISKSFR